MELTTPRLFANVFKIMAGLCLTVALAQPAQAWEECGPYVNTSGSGWCLDPCTRQDNYERQCYECSWDPGISDNSCFESYWDILSLLQCGPACGGGSYCPCAGGGGGGGGGGECYWWEECYWEYQIQV